MKKKLSLWAAFITLLITVFGFQVGALSENRPYEETDTIKIVDHVVYELREKDGTQFFRVIDYFDTNEAAEATTEINIVKEIDGIPVKEISAGVDDEGRLEYDTIPNITKITIPDTVTNVDNASFSGLTGVEEIKLPDSIEYLGTAFFKVKNLKTITIPEKQIIIPVNAFAYCENLEEVIIKGDVRHIEDGAFKYCTSLKKINIPESTEHIWDYAFYRSGLESITLPKTGLSECSFDSCTELKEIIIEDKGSSKYIGFPPFAFADCTSLEKIYILGGTPVFDEYAFDGCEKITDVYFWGSAEKWYSYFSGSTMESFSGNDRLLTANIHYYYNHSHSFTKTEKASTCLKEGTCTYTCVCGDSETYATPKSGHSYGSWKISKKPTKKADGAIKRTCCVCKKVQTKAVVYGYKPSKTTKLTAESTNSQIILKWNSVKGATGYRVYRYDEKQGKYIKISNTGSTQLTVSSLIPGFKYKYAVKAYAKIDGKTYWAKEYKAIETATKPYVPQLAVYNSRGETIIRWSKVNIGATQYNDIDGENKKNAVSYALYMSDSKDGKYTKILTVKRNPSLIYEETVHSGKGTVRDVGDFIMFENTELKKGTYYFKIRAYVTAGGKNICSPFSKVVSYTVK